MKKTIVIILLLSILLSLSACGAKQPAADPDIPTPSEENTADPQGSATIPPDEAEQTEITQPEPEPIVVDYQDIRAYSSDYGYNWLGESENGEAKQRLYQEIDAAAILFHTDTTIDAQDNVVAYINYENHGLTDQEAVLVWQIYRCDHPLFYWMSGRLPYGGFSDIVIYTDEEYAAGADRANYNQLIYSAVEDYVEDLLCETSAYQFALALHNSIVLSCGYAFERIGGVPSDLPEDDVWAHNILGILEKGSGVCESYAKTFQLLLNFLGIPNVYVEGDADGEAHAWNLVQMDDGQWYWFDLTWDDRTLYADSWQVNYDYFCLNDTQLSRTIYSPYGLPIPATTSFESNELQAGHIFTLKDASYMVIGKGEVQLTSVTATGSFVIPETVTYEGRTYTVVAIGHENPDYALSVINSKGTLSLTIPKTVIHIRNYAFISNRITEYYVDPENQYLTSRDGVLFTKSLYTLIAYPCANPRTEYTIPDETVSIAEAAFWGFKEDPVYLKKLTIGKNCSWLGQPNMGYKGSGFYDSDPYEGEVVWNGRVIGWLPRVVQDTDGLLTIAIHPENKHYVIVDGGFYSADMGVLYAMLNPEITFYHIPETLRLIDGSEVFAICKNLAYFTTDGAPPVPSKRYALPSAPNSFVYDGILYSKGYYEDYDTGITKERTIIECVPYGISGEVTVPDGVTFIDIDFGENHSFRKKDRITSITLPVSLERIDVFAFGRCTSLKTINYKGTMEQWEAIEKTNGWDFNMPAYVIHCTDGDIYPQS